MKELSETVPPQLSSSAAAAAVGCCCCCTDSQALFKAIQFSSPSGASINKQLKGCSSNIVLQWILAHSGFTSKTMADLKARSVAYNSDEPYQPVSLPIAISALSPFIRDPPWSQDRTAAVYKNHDEAQNETAVQNRREAVRLAQIRSRHFHAFKAYHHLMDSSVDPTCPDCGQATYTMEDWLLKCSAITEAGTDIFGQPNLTPDVLRTSPQEVIMLAGRTLF